MDINTSLYEHNSDGMLVDPDTEKTYALYLGDTYTDELPTSTLHEAGHLGVFKATGISDKNPEASIDAMLARMRASTPAPTSAIKNHKINGKWGLHFTNPIGFGKHKTLTLQEVIDKQYSYFQWMVDQDMFHMTDEIESYLED